MLVAFALKNHACFRDRQELSMEATTTSDDTFAFDTGVRRAPRLHRSSVIYGANGSGKSRLLQGLAYARAFVAGSSKDRHAGEEIDCVPFSVRLGVPDTADDLRSLVYRGWYRLRVRVCG